VFIDLAASTPSGTLRATVSFTTIAEGKPMVSEEDTSTKCALKSRDHEVGHPVQKAGALGCCSNAEDLHQEQHDTHVYCFSYGFEATRPEITITNAVNAMRLRRGVFGLSERTIIPTIKNARMPTPITRFRRSSRPATLRYTPT